jgi:hypothetical protein
MSAAREKDQADFDLERFVDMFDEALISQDPRVVNALRSLMMMVTLTRPESRDRNSGPLRRLFEDVNHLNRRMHGMEDEIRRLGNRTESYKDKYSYPYERFSMAASQAMAAQIDQDVLNQFKPPVLNKLKGF